MHFREKVSQVTRTLKISRSQFLFCPRVHLSCFHVHRARLSPIAHLRHLLALFPSLELLARNRPASPSINVRRPTKVYTSSAPSRILVIPFLRPIVLVVMAICSTDPARALFGKFDTQAGYNNIRITPEDTVTYKTGFKTSKGLFEWIVMLFNTYPRLKATIEWTPPIKGFTPLRYATRATASAAEP